MSRKRPPHVPPWGYGYLPAPWVTPFDPRPPAANLARGVRPYGALGDPNEDRIVAEPKDPNEDRVVAEPKDPSLIDPDAYPWAYGPTATPPWYATPPAPCRSTCPCEEGDSAPGSGNDGSEYSGFVIVRLREGILPDAAEPDPTLYDFAMQEQLVALAKALEIDLEGNVESSGPTMMAFDEAGGIDGDPRPNPIVGRPLIRNQVIERAPSYGGDPVTLCAHQELDNLEARAATTRLGPRHSLRAYWRVDTRPWADRIPSILARLQAVPQVDLAYRELAATDPSDDETAKASGFGDDQSYLDDAPIGLSLRWAAEQLGASPRTIRLVDLEQRWITAHEAHSGTSPLASFGSFAQLPLLFGDNRDPQSGHHGTAVVTQLIGGAFGTTSSIQGIATEIAQLAIASHWDDGFAGNVAEAIVHALLRDFERSDQQNNFFDSARVQLDLLLLEVQRSYLPTEVDPADFDAIRLATALGVSVVEAAGNGGRDLDRYEAPWGGRPFASGASDSGAILVGAGQSRLPHDRRESSNFGRRVDCYAWGDSVVSAGYGDLSAVAAEAVYTSSFSGTSSASPCIAGAAALVLSLTPTTDRDDRLPPRQLRALLRDPGTGTPQGPNVPGLVGVMPDLRKVLGGAVGLVPDVYFRQRLEDDGWGPRHRVPTASCVDLVPLTKKIAGSWIPSLFGQGDPLSRLVAPGAGITDDLDRLLIRVRNRGACPAVEVRAHAYCAPIATLVTPAMWRPLGQAMMAIDTSATTKTPPLRLPVAEGDLIAYLEPLDLAGSAAWSPSHRSFLAVLGQDCENPLPLPPDAPYFDWSVYRRFLRSRKVGWRNVHLASKTDWPRLDFLFVGTPDDRRRFDFEIVRRLPKSVQLTLHAPEGFAARLRQHRSWAAGSRGEASPIVLPPTPRPRFGGVPLRAGFSCGVSFEISGATDDIQVGHSLAIRQLWRGEEVGRITWYLAP